MQSVRQAVEAGVGDRVTAGGHVKWSGAFAFDEDGEMHIVGRVKTVSIGGSPVGAEIEPGYAKNSETEGHGVFEAEFYFEVSSPQEERE